MNLSQPPSAIDQALTRALPFPLFVVDRDCVVHQTNPKAEQLGSELGLGKVLPAEVLSQVKGAIAQSQSLAGHDHPLPVSLSNGRSYLLQVCRLGGVFHGQDGWALLLVDGTEPGDKGGMKAKTLSALSHEVKTPLTSIRLSLLLLLEEKIGALNPDQRELLEVACDECEHMLTNLQSQLQRAQGEGGTRLSPRTDRAG